MPKATEEQKKQARERLAMYYSDILGISCREFERNAGMPYGYIKTYSCNPQRNTLAAFKATYPALNIDWVNTGRGKMWNDGYEDRLCEVHKQSDSDRQSSVFTHFDIEEYNEDLRKLVDNLIRENEKKQATIERMM